MADSYPSLGIRIDLNQFVQARTLVRDLREEYRKLGEDKEGAAKAGGASSTRAAQTERAAMAQTLAQSKSMFTQRVALTRQMFAEQAKATKDAERASARSAQDSLSFNMRMTRQRAAEAAASGREEMAAARSVAAAQQRAAQDTFNFNQRMTRQRVAEAEAAGKAEANAARVAAEAERKFAQDAFAFRMRMNRQRAAEEAAAERSTVTAAATAAREREAIARQEAQIERTLMERNMQFRAQQVIAAAQQQRAASAAASATRYSGPGIPAQTPAAPLGALAQGWQAVIGAVTSSSTGFLGVLGRMRNALGDIRSAFFDARTAVAVFAGALVLGPLIDMTDQMTALQARTAFFAARASDVPYTFQAIYRAAQDARAPLEAIGTLYTRLAPLAERLGKSQQGILATTTTVAKGLAIGGASRQESAASAQQLAQALASNRLGGDELRSLAENAPLLLSKIAESLNMNSGEFIKWAHSGKANAAVVIGAIDAAASSIDAMFKSFPTTISQSITLVTNAFTHLVSEVNSASGAGGGIAGLISQFAGFLEAQTTINAVIGAVNGLATAMTVLGQAFSVVVDYLPAIGAGILAMGLARILPPIFASLAVSVRAYALSAAIAGPATTAFSISMGAARAAATGLMAGLGRMTAFLGGPLGIALIAAAAAFSYLNANALDTQETFNKFGDAQQGAASALERGITFMNAYGGSTKEMTDILLALNNVQSDQVAGLDEAGRAAYARAENERQLTASLLERAAAEQTAAAAGLRRAATVTDLSRWNRQLDPALAGARVRRAVLGKSSPELDAAEAEINRLRGQAQFQRELADTLEKSAPETLRAAQLVRSTPINITQPAQGSGVVTSTNDTKPDKGLLRRMASLKEEIADSKTATLQINREMAARRDLSQTIATMYATGLPAAEAYGNALKAQSSAELEASVAAERAKVFQDDKVKGLVDLALALAKAKEETIRAADAQKTLNLELAEKDAMAQATGETLSYVKALQLSEFEIYRQERALRILQKTKDLGGNSSLATQSVDNTYKNDATREEADRLKVRQDALRYAGMSANEAEREQRAVAMAVNAMKQGTQESEKTALAWARTQVAAEQFTEEMTKLRGEQKTAMRDQFAETGKLNLEPLRKQIATKIRQGVYDAVLAGPINMIVDVAVDVASDGIKKLKDQLKSIWEGINTEGRAGTGNMFENFSGKILNGLDGFFKKIGGKGGSTAGSFATNMLGGMQVGRSAADAVGFSGSTSHPGWQRIMDTAAAAVGNYFGGPIGAAAATFLSRAVGKAILGKESNHGAIASFDASGNFTGTLTGSKRNEETSGLATTAATGITQGIAALREVGANLTTTVTKLDIGTRDTTHIDFSGGQHLETAMGDSEAAIQASLLLIAKSATFADANLQKFADSIENSATTVDELITKLQAYTQAQDFVKSIGTANLQYTNPRAYQLAQLRDAQLARRDQVSQYAAQGFLSATQLAAVNAQLKELEQSEIADVVKNFADSIDGAVHSLADFKSAQADILSYTRSLLTSSLSTLSPTAQLQTAGADFFSQLASAKGGDFEALSNITGTADEYLKQAQSYYGSSGAYAAIFQTVQDALNGLGTQQFDDPLADDIAKASADLQAAILAAGAQIVAAINGANDNLVTTTADSGALTQAQVDQMIAAMTAAGTLTTEQLAQLGEVLSTTNWQALSNLASQMAGAATYDRALTGGIA